MILKNGKRLDGCSDTVPIGTINPYIGSVAPYGYLICEGQLVSKTTYKELYEICGDKFGTGTETEFRLPDLRGRTIAGYKEGDLTFGTLGGLIGALTKSYTPAGTNTGGTVQSHTLTADESGIPNNLYTNIGVYKNTGTVESISLSGQSGGLQINRNISNQDGAKIANKSDAKNGHTHDFTQPTFTGTQADINVVQPTITLNWIVKAFLLMPNQSYVSTVNQDSDINTYSCNYINTMLTHNHVRKTINNQSGFTDLSPFTTTVTKDGFAIIQVRLLTASATAGMTIRILKNGSAINHSYYHNLPDATELNEQAMIDVKKGDVISLNNDQGKFYGTDLYNTFDMVII